jgi:tetratricopeptide (TPR) repeat protein
LKAIEMAPGQGKYYLAAARFFEGRQMGEQAGGMVQKALDAQGQDPGVLEAAARYYLRARDVERAVQLNDQLLGMRPNYLPAVAMRGELLMHAREWSEAIAVFDRVLGQAPDESRVHFHKGVAHFQRGELSVAKTSLSTAIRLNPQESGAKITLADIYLRERFFDGAEKLILEVLREQPDNYNVLLQLGRAQLGQRKLEAAGETFNRMVALDGDNPQGHFYLGLVHRGQADAPAALARFETALSLDAAMVSALAQMVQLYSAQGEFDKAIDLCERQLARNPDAPFVQAAILDMKGRVFAAQQKDGEAVRAFEAAIERAPTLMQPYFGLARIHSRRGEQEQAIRQYLAALEKNPNQTGAHFLVGTLYQGQERLDEAEKHYREALRIDAEFAPAANNLAYLLADADGDLGEALQLAQTARRTLPEDPYVMDTLGWVYYKRGLYDSAIAEFTGSIEKLPDNATIHYHLGLALHKKGDVDRARAALERALALDPGFAEADAARRILEAL